MERADPPALAGVFSPAPLRSPGAVELGDETAHHLRVRRVAVGDGVRVTDGAGALGTGTLTRLAKNAATVELHAVERHEPPPPFHLLVPVGDRDRMLLLAEKATELGLRSWTAVVWQRSRSVSPRGEGAAFRDKVRLRMTSALVQSGGAWLPELRDDVDVDALASLAPDSARLLLDAGGEPLLALAPPGGPACIAFGPEGGMTPAERARLLDAGWAAASLARPTLRFETAGIVALGVLHAAALAGTAPA